MYVIVEIAGLQYKVYQDRFVYIPRLKQKEGENVTFNRVLLLERSGSVTIGTPFIKKIQVIGKVLSHIKSDKIIVFKKKRRKGYKIKQGHRQKLTKLKIISINTQ
ncbi:50S ribosomal protein L21 [Candidatus Walczuchella endosymbiont of Icerya purchasi]|uniref:50S ribosomal protein L21 n=1 Tax=Candidatus Walczuchella endosymbiont of Icerya purchasi TaxID=3066219 RepID=UPI00313E0126